MKSLKNIIGSIMITLLIILIVLIVFNVFYINDLTHKLYETHYLIGEIKENYLEMDLPLRVLNNISSQDIESMDETRLNSIMDANNRNTDLLKELVEKNNQLVLKSKIMISDYNNSIIFRFFGTFNNSYQAIHLIEEQFNELSSQIEKLLGNEIINNKTFSIITDKYKSIKPLLDDSIYAFDQNIISIMDLYIQTNNILIGIMGLIVLILLFLLNRIAKIDLTYIIKAFSQMNQQDFQTKNLPLFQPKFREEKNIEAIVHQVMQEQDFLQKIKIVTSRGYLLTEVIDNLFEMIEGELHVDRVGIAFVNYKDEEIIAEYGIANYDKILLGSGFNVSFKDTSLYKLIENPKTRSAND